MDTESKYIIRKMCIDLFVLICVAFPLLAFHLWVTPHHRGYFRNDTSLMLPYKDSTITENVLAAIGFTVNIITVVAVEVVRSRRGGGAIVAKRRLVGFNVPVWVWEVYQVLGVFFFGACCQQLTTSLGKYSVGSLRPHFFSVCDPLPAATVPADQLYVEDYVCRGTDAARLRDMRLAFPSAHSAFAAYAFIFFAMYINARFKWGSVLLRHGLQFVGIMFAWYTGLSRVVDNKHHPGDIVVGFVIGAIYAVLVFLYVCHIGRVPNRVTWDGDTRPPAARLVGAA